jgi:ORF6N domain
MDKQIIPVARIVQSIHVLRGQKIMLSQDLAALYGVSVGALTQAVKRNANRFPKDFVFQLTAEELTNLKSQFVISSWGGLRTRPYAFTEQGVAMLSSVLKSEQTGERTRLACRRWRPRHRELFLCLGNDSSHIGLRSFSARRRKEHARGVCSRIRNHQ